MSDARHRRKRQREAELRAQDAVVDQGLEYTEQQARRRRSAEEAEEAQLAELQRRAEDESPPVAALARFHLAQRAVRTAEARVAAARADAAEKAKVRIAALTTLDRVAERRATRDAEAAARLPEAYDALDDARRDLAAAEADRRAVARGELERLHGEHGPEHRAALARAVEAFDDFEAALREVADVGGRFRGEAAAPAHTLGAAIPELGAGPPHETLMLRLRQWAHLARGAAS